MTPPHPATSGDGESRKAKLKEILPSGRLEISAGFWHRMMKSDYYFRGSRWGFESPLSMCEFKSSIRRCHEANNRRKLVFSSHVVKIADMRIMPFRSIYRRGLLFVLLLVLVGCGSNTAAPPLGYTILPITHMKIADRQFTIEIARSEQEQLTGLMHRPSLDVDHGMIFPFDHEQILNFWNKDVHFPLDLIFMDHHGTIVSLRQMNAYDKTQVSSDVPASIVIELNKGTYDSLNLKTGMAISIPAEVTESQ
jgi:hypothetical protein